MSDSKTAPDAIGESSKLTEESTTNDTVQQVFSMFKSYLEKRFDQRGKKIELTSRAEKEIVQLKYKGKQKQFELKFDLKRNLLGRIKAEHEYMDIHAYPPPPPPQLTF